MPYRPCVDAMPDPLFVCDANAVILHANPHVQPQLSLEPDVLPGVSMFDIIHPDYREHFITATRSAAEQAPRPVTGELLIGRVMGRSRHVSYSVSAARDLLGESGLIVRFTPHVPGAGVRDTFRLDHMLFRMYDVYYRTDAGGNVLSVSQSVEHFLGYLPDEVIGTPLAQYYQNPDHRTRFLEELAHEGFVVGFEAPMRHRDGSIRWVSTSAHLLHDDDGNVTGVEGIGRDITARKQAESELLSANAMLREKTRSLDEINRTLEGRISEETRQRIAHEQLLVQQSKLAEIGELMGAIAHQWRQPLDALGLQIQDLADAAAFDGVDVDYITARSEDMMNHIRFMNRTIEDFRNFHRPSREPVVFNAAVALRQVLALIMPQMRQHGIELRVEVATDAGVRCSFTSDHSSDVEQCCTSENDMNECLVHGVPGEFQQVILAITENARTAITAQGSLPGGWVDVCLKCDPAGVSVTISDNGGGIPDSALPHVFDPWFTTRPDKGGTGIGLSVARTIIHDNMSGTIEASNTDSGAMFTLTLPPAPGT